MQKSTALDTFQGDFSAMWRWGIREPLWHMTRDWWWWLVMLDDLMVTGGENNSWCSGHQRQRQGRGERHAMDAQRATQSSRWRYGAGRYGLRMVV